MDVYLLNFASTTEDKGFRDFHAVQRRQNFTARLFGIRNIVSWQRKKLLQSSFYHQHKWVLDQYRGAGYWLWKPYIINDQLQTVRRGDIVIYLDSDISILDNLEPLIKLCLINDGFFLVETRKADRLCRHWIKRDCFHYMGMDQEKFHEAYMCPGGLQIYQKNERTLEFVSQFLHFAMINEHLFTDEPNTCGKPNLKGFIEHRHDQGVLSLLRVKFGIQGFRWPTQWGNVFKMEAYREKGEWLDALYSDKPYVNSPYGTILWHGSLTNNQGNYTKSKLLLRLEMIWRILRNRIRNGPL